MLLSQTAEYALRAAVWLADTPETPHTTQEIAEVTKVPAGYLSKVMQALGRAGLVTSQRGLGGGFLLTRSPDDLTVLDIINAVDPVQRIHQCPLGLKSHGKKLCPLHRKLDDAMADMEEAFASTLLSELLHPDNKIKPLCEVTVGGKKA